MKLDFNLLENEIFSTLGNKKIMVLATSFDGSVTARNMSCIIIGKRIYFQTDTKLQKIKQIIGNPNVALCVDNIQIEGVARIGSHPFDDENCDFASAFRDAYKGSYESYSHMKNEVVVAVEPTLITLWKYEDAQPYRDFLNYKNNRAYREVYETE